MQVDGWELAGELKQTLSTALTFRRVKPKMTTRTKVAIFVPLGVALACFGLLLILGQVERSESTAIGSATPSHSATPSASPSRSPRPTATPEQATAVSDAELVSAFQTYFDERATAGVVLAKTVSEITYADRVVQITFDPATGSISRDTFDFAISSWPNLGSFAATPVAFNDAIGNRLRPYIESIVTVESDGTPLGTFSAADILALNGLSE